MRLATDWSVFASTGQRANVWVEKEIEHSTIDGVAVFEGDIVR